MEIGDKDRYGNTLVLGGWKENLLRTSTGKFIVGVQVLDTEKAAMEAYNAHNCSELPTNYISESFQPWFEKNKVANREYDVPSSRGNTVYQVKFDKLGNTTCNCPGFLFRRDCWHIKAIKDLVKEGEI